MSSRVEECNSYFQQFTNFTLKYTPRAVVALYCGYYCLGVAYSSGLMAAIDKVAIKILVKQVGYVGLGAVMPTFQWYSAWAVRLAAALIGTLIYDLIEKIAKASYRWLLLIEPA